MTQTASKLPAALLRCLFMALTLGVTSLAQAQGALCSSEGQSEPLKLMERFTSADCASCWRDPATPAAAADTLALDWIVPGQDDAPLSVAARTEAQTRLRSLHLTEPATQSQQIAAVQGWPSAELSVAQGLPVGDYVGASIDLKLPPGEVPELPVQAWLLLVESLPAGTEGSPVARNLVRNALQPLWDARSMESDRTGVRFSDLRAMSIPDGAQPQRLRLVGWVQDAQGRLLSVVHTGCAAGAN